MACGLLGATVLATDLPEVLPLLNRNIEANTAGQLPAHVHQILCFRGRLKACGRDCDGLRIRLAPASLPGVHARMCRFAIIVLVFSIYILYVSAALLLHELSVPRHVSVEWRLPRRVRRLDTFSSFRGGHGRVGCTGLQPCGTSCVGLSGQLS